MAQELKVCEAYICHNEFSQDELPQKKDAIVKSASYNEEDDWWDYAAKIECYRKEDADKVIAEKDAFIKTLGEGQAYLTREIEQLKDENERLQRALWIARVKKWFERWYKRWLELAEKFKDKEA